MNKVLFHLAVFLTFYYAALCLSANNCAPSQNIFEDKQHFGLISSAQKPMVMNVRCNSRFLTNQNRQLAVCQGQLPVNTQVLFPVSQQRKKTLVAPTTQDTIQGAIQNAPPALSSQTVSPEHVQSPAPDTSSTSNMNLEDNTQYNIQPPQESPKCDGKGLPNCVVQNIVDGVHNLGNAGINLVQNVLNPPQLYIPLPAFSNPWNIQIV